MNIARLVENPRRSLAIAAFALSQLVSTHAFASDKALAESLFEAGRELMKEGKVAEACPKFAESQRQDPSPGTLINLAKCHETLGQTASAWAEFKEASTLARSMGRGSQAEFADDAVKRLEPKLSRLRIDPPPSSVPGLVVTRDGVEIGVASLGTALAVDPGEHLIEAKAAGYETFSAKVTVRPDGDSQSVALPALAQSAATAPSPQAEPAPKAEESKPEPQAGGSNHTLAYVIGGVGIAGVGVGVVFGLLAKSQADAAKDDPALCPKKSCSPAGRSEIDAAETKALVSTIGFGVGAVGIGVGAFLLLSGSSDERAERVRHVIADVGPGRAVLGYRGSF
ncbi:MAG TPA: hypothetical protein VF103_04590 [Polyangiaceae bacterium]